jgi:hypothetical protein
MLFDNPVGDEKILPDRKHYENHPDAVFRHGTDRPLVTQDFGPSDVKVEPTVDWRGGESNIFGKRIEADTYPNFHRALDISTGNCTAKIRAAADGTVVVSNKNESGAKVIVIDHGIHDGRRFRTGYVHLSERMAHVGDPVTAGEIIGIMGSTGISTDCHLHFYVKRNKRYVDPWRRLRQNTSIDPDAPAASPLEPVPDPEPEEVPDMPIPASDEEYVAGKIAVIGNTDDGALVRDQPEKDATVLRTVPAGEIEEWRPTCWVKGDLAFDSDRWLTRWFEGQWEFTHRINVANAAEL